MNVRLSMRSSAVVAALSLTLFPLAAFAETPPSYVANDRASAGGETVHGTIESISGRDLYLHDDRGFVDHIVLRDGTVVNPTGFALGEGAVVAISGQNAGSVLRADQIDAANGEDEQPGVAPVPDDGAQVYQGDTFGGGYAYPYAYGYPYGYGYGYPGIGIYFGGGYGGYGGRGYFGHGYGGHGYGGPGNGGRGYGGGTSFGHGSSGGGSRGASGGSRR